MSSSLHTMLKLSKTTSPQKCPNLIASHYMILWRKSVISYITFLHACLLCGCAGISAHFLQVIADLRQTNEQRGSDGGMRRVVGHLAKSHLSS